MATDRSSGSWGTVPATSGGSIDPAEAGLERETDFSHSGRGVPREAEAGSGSSPSGAGERGGEGQERDVTHTGEDNGFQLYDMVDDKGAGKVMYVKDQEDEQKHKLETTGNLAHRSLLQVGGDQMEQERVEQTMTKKSAVPRDLQPAESNPLTVIEGCDDSETREAFQGMLQQVKIKDEEIRRLQEKMRSDAGRMKEHNRKASKELLQLKDELKVARESSNYVSDHDLGCFVGEHAFLEENVEQTKRVNQELTAKQMKLEQANEELRLSEERARKEINSLSANYRKMADQNQAMRHEGKALRDQTKRFSQVSSDLATADTIIQRLKQENDVLRRENTELQSQVEITKAQAAIFEEDFQNERKDREKAAIRYEEQREGLSRQVEEVRQVANEELERYKKIVESLEVIKEKSEISLQQAHEEIQVKSSQVKQYKKQVDSLKEQMVERELQSTNLIQEFEKLRGELVKSKVKKDKKSKKSSTSKEPTPSPAHSPVTMKSIPPGTVSEEVYRKMEGDYDRTLEEKISLQKELDDLKQVYADLQGMFQREQKQQLPHQIPDAVSPIPEEPAPPPRTGKKQRSPGPPSQPATHSPHHQQPAIPPATHPQHLGISHAQQPPPSNPHQRATPSSYPRQSPSSQPSSLEQNRALSAAYRLPQPPQQQAHGAGYYDQTEERAAGSGAFANQFQNQAEKGAHSASSYPSGVVTSMPAVGEQRHQSPVRANPYSSEPQRAVLSPMDPQLGGISSTVGEPLRAGMPHSNAPPRAQEPKPQPRGDFRSRMSSSPPDVDTFPEPVIRFDQTYGQQSDHAQPQSDHQAHYQPGQLQHQSSQGYTYPQDQYQHRQNMGLPLDHSEPGGMNIGRLSPSLSPVSPQYSSHGSSIAPPQPRPRRQLPGQSQSHPDLAPIYAQKESRSESQPPPLSPGHYPTQASMPAHQAQHPQQVGDESALIKGIDSDISQEAEHVAEMLSDGSRQRPTRQHVPYDRNLVCPQCKKMFRVGEIQKFRSHVRECKEPNGTESSYV